MVVPTEEVLLEADSDAALDSIHNILAGTSDRVERTRKGRVWNIWKDGRPVHVAVRSNPPTVELSAGLNGDKDYAFLRQVSTAFVAALGGIASVPMK